MTKSRTDITKINEEIGNRDSEFRKERSTERKGVVEIPDGKGGVVKMTRTPHDSLGRGGLKLYLPAKEGMYRQWISDEVDGNLQEYVNMGFTPVIDDNGNPYEPRRGGVRKENTVYQMYAMEIPKNILEKLIEQDRTKNPILLAKEQQDRWIEGQHNEELGTYNPTVNEVKVLK